LRRATAAIIQPRISRITRIRNDGFPIRDIREIRGEKSSLKCVVRFTRLNNAFSKKQENLEHNVALYFMHYNFCRIHQTVRITPAMEAGLTDRVLTLEEIVQLLP
jgi:hypothetical protein